MEAFSEWDYFGLFLASFIAATVLPLSSEIVFSVLIVNNYDLAICLVVATMGNWIGGMSSYALGWLAKWSFIEKYLRIKKERIQIFGGIIISRKGSGIHETFTVRRIASGVGVERVFPVHSPLIDKVEVDRESVTMRARMYYLRDRIGKEANKVKEKRLFEAKRKGR